LTFALIFLGGTMKFNSLLVFFIVSIFAFGALAYGDTDPTGTYNGTVQLEQTIVSINQEITKSGTVEIKITSNQDNKYRVLIKTKIPDLPDTDDTNEYTLSGSTLTLHQETNVSGILIETNGTFTLTGNNLTGTVSTVGKTTSDGTVQTSSNMAFTANK